MSVMQLNLPQYLFIETRDDQGLVTGSILDADRLLAWAEHGYGDAIGCYCRKLLDSEIQAINAWQERRLLLLDERWQEEENDENDDAAERQYAQACEDVVAEADRRRDRAASHMARRQAAIEHLVREAEAHMAENRPAEDEDMSMGLLFALLAIGVLVYTLLT